MDGDFSKVEVVDYNKHYDKSTKFSCTLLATMSFEIQKSFKILGEFNINEHLKETFQEHDEEERFKILISLMDFKSRYELCMRTKSENEVVH